MSLPQPGTPLACDFADYQRFTLPWVPPCEQRGDHVCVSRAVEVETFFRTALVHTKGIWAGKPFVLSSWQRDEIVVPLVATVTWSAQYGRFVRRYNNAWVELGRKNGKSELMAGLGL